jgi:Icc-related predicted phosphoesterase
MRIYAVADIHARTPLVANVLDNVRAYGAEVLLLAGDITGFRHPESILARFEQSPVPVLVIRGNSDPPWIATYLKKSAKLISLHLRRIEQNGVPFIGLGGTLPLPFSSRIAWNEKKRLAALEPLVDPSSVLVVHPPPRGTLDTVFGKFQAGSAGLKRFVLQARPALVVCGHIHECPGWQKLGSSLVVNCSAGRQGQGALIDHDGRRGPVVQLL